MNWLWRWLIGSVVFVGLFSLGWYALGIRPSLAEILLVVVAVSISNGIEEGLK